MIAQNIEGRYVKGGKGGQTWRRLKRIEIVGFENVLA